MVEVWGRGHLASKVVNQRMHRKWGWTTKPQAHTPSLSLPHEPPPLKGSITYPNSATCWGPCIQTHEPIGGISHWYHNSEGVIKQENAPKLPLNFYGWAVAGGGSDATDQWLDWDLGEEHLHSQAVCFTVGSFPLWGGPENSLAWHGDPTLLHTLHWALTSCSLGQVISPRRIKKKIKAATI